LIAGALLVGCQSTGSCPGGGAPPAILTVVDAHSGATIADASAVARNGAFSEQLTLCGSNYCLGSAKAGTYQITVTAPGYEQGHASLDVSVDSCNVVDSTQHLSVKLLPACASLVMHVNGAGQQWSDCTPEQTYNQTQASAACMNLPYQGALTCSSIQCPDPDGGVSFAVCSDVRTNEPTDSGPPCDCWTYQGPGAGHVRISNSGCQCGVGTDPTWY
jgi:hypothetical protein